MESLKLKEESENARRELEQIEERIKESQGSMQEWKT
jgi:hypothetical protein